MRRVNYLGLLGRCGHLYGIVLYAAEVSAPPCAVPSLFVIRLGLPYIGSVECIALFGHGILLNALDEDKSVGVNIEDSLCTVCSSVCPVVLIL